MPEKLFRKYGEYLSPKDLLEILPYGRNKIYNLLRSGEIKSRKCGSEYLIIKSDLMQYLGITERKDSVNANIDTIEH